MLDSHNILTLKVTKREILSAMHKVDNFTEIIGFIEASMMRLFLLSDRGLTTQHAEPALKSRVRLRASMLSPL